MIPEHLAKAWGEPLPHDVRYAEVRVADLKGRVIRCPGYNSNRLGLYDWCWAPELSKARKPQFMAALRESITTSGIRNPVITYATDEGLFLSFGGSRALAARELELETIPAVINDYSGEYASRDEVTPGNFSDYFTDVPKYFEFTPYGVETHYGMEKNRRKQYDPGGIEWAREVDSTFLATEFSWLGEYTTGEE